MGPSLWASPIGSATGPTPSGQLHRVSPIRSAPSGQPHPAGNIGSAHSAYPIGSAPSGPPHPARPIGSAPSGLSRSPWSLRSSCSLFPSRSGHWTLASPGVVPGSRLTGLPGREGKTQVPAVADSFRDKQGEVLGGTGQDNHPEQGRGEPARRRELAPPSHQSLKLQVTRQTHSDVPSPSSHKPHSSNTRKTLVFK